MSLFSLTCSVCGEDCVSAEELRHHRLVQHKNECRLPFRSSESESLYGIIVYRDSDLHFCCPFEGCDFHVLEKDTFLRHFPRDKSRSPEWTIAYEHGHQSNWREFKIGVKEAPMEVNFPCFEYMPAKVPAKVDGVIDPRPALPSAKLATTESLAQIILNDTAPLVKASSTTLAPFPEPTTTGSLAKLSISDNATLSTAPSMSSDQSTITSSSNIQKVETNKDENLKATLKEEYKKRLHKEMMHTLLDETADFKESGRKLEEMRAWFEEGMRMLGEVDGGAKVEGIWKFT
ncbi:hypothetical protein BJ508DRAFT_313782 [Ascobolus immersus RN42]|uniref:C2H2-type domain-containing protein n=1 Tax=Ascobolus immersus RN42 TaxID=1160509 RepID=A0A3N4HNS7_ASCIM|nr:hypothetical protein BJ508DRAFT_313782 [Ascobolus immersus RN42]